jgi:lipid A disaccharide synthetase
VRKVSVRVRFEVETTLEPGELEQVVLDTLAVSPGSRETEIGELSGVWVETIEDVSADEGER